MNYTVTNATASRIEVGDSYGAPHSIDPGQSLTLSLLPGTVLSLTATLGAANVVYVPPSPGAFADLTDVSVSSPTQGQVPTYQAGTGRWTNEDPSGGGGTITLGTTAMSLGSTYGAISGDIAWSGMQSFQGGLSVPNGVALQLNGDTDGNWRLGLGQAFFNTVHVGRLTSTQIVVGAGASGPDGFAVGNADGVSLLEVDGHYEVVYVTAPNGLNVNACLALQPGATLSNFPMSLLTDTAFSGLSAGQVPTWSGTQWVNETPTGGGGSSTLAGDSDVAIVSPATGDTLVYDDGASKWRNYPGAPADAHVYWRVTGQSAMMELELHAGFAGNVARGGTPLASSTYGGYPASYAFDGGYYGSGSGQWSGNGAAGTDWIGYEFASPVEVTRVLLDPGALGTQTYSNYTVDYSDDGVTWYTKWTQALQPANSAQYPLISTDPAWRRPTYSGSPWGAHSYWRMMAFNDTGGAVAGDAAAFLSSPDHGVPLSVGGTATAYTTYGSTSVASMFACTGNWTSNSTLNGTWAQYEFASPVAVGALLWKASSPSLAQTPTDFCIQFSDDGTHWTTAWTVNGATWSAGQTQVFGDPNWR